MSENKIKSITKIYYSNPEIQRAIFEFSKDRETIPKYFLGYGKRPDTLQYPADVMGLVNKGTTSFHCSEEIWNNPLEIDSEMDPEELSRRRKAWDLLIDIDSPYLDYSKTAASLIIKTIEKYGIINYGLKFSGSKGFHIIVPGKAFPEEFEGILTKEMFPEWPRAISEFLMSEIRKEYNEIISKSKIDFKALKARTDLSEEDITESICPNCGEASKEGHIIYLKCDKCSTEVVRKNNKISKRQLRCIDDICPGFLQVAKKEPYYYCDNCKASSFDKKQESGKKIIYSKEAKFSHSDSYSKDFKSVISAENLGSLDLVLVASRHLFRSPYSLHEKTALASVVISKDEIQDFSPKDASPLNVKVKPFYPKSKANEASRLLAASIAWKKIRTQRDDSDFKKKYKKFEKITVTGVTEDIFPRPIKKLLLGLSDGKKRGLFILLTFLKTLNFSPEYINTKVRDWNKKNKPPLRDGYVKSQVDWHLRQNKQILPPNYSNKNFYQDLKLVNPEAMPNAKNPIVEVLRKVKAKENYQ